MSEMVERVARALWDDRYPDDEWSPTDKRDFMGHARAALEIMRDPPRDMLMAPGAPYQGRVAVEDGLKARCMAWNAMIDAALTSPEGRPYE